MLPVRLTFEKLGLARYISHLDLMRCFERSLRRADIPFWFTEGFNPRPFLTFALPLSLGYGSVCELVDIKLTEDDYPLEGVVRRLNECLPEGLRILSAAVPEKKAKYIAFARYSITLEGFSGADSLSEYLGRDCITVTKVNKKKQSVEIDIKPMIREYSVSASEGGDTVLDIVLASGCTDNCNPSLIFEPFLESAGMGGTPVAVVRTGILDAEMNLFK